MTSAVRSCLAPCSTRVWSGVFRRTRADKLFQTAAKGTTATPSVELEEPDLTLGNVPSFKAFLDFKFVQDNLELVKGNCRKRKAHADPDAVARLYSEWVSAKQTWENLRAARNENGKAMKVNVRSG